MSLCVTLNVTVMQVKTFLMRKFVRPVLIRTATVNSRYAASHVAAVRVAEQKNA